MSKTIVTRFAPSPTGYLHIGGARTALFNWLYAQHAKKSGRGGKFLLRIEDTDRARHTPQAVDAILEGLKWLGLDWDGEAISQFERSPRHAEIAREMVARGKAYYCYTPQDEITAMREAATAKGEHFQFKSPYRDNGGREKNAPAPAGDEKAVIRLKAPLTGETVIDDQVQGRVVIQNKELDDMVLLRSDGTPTYMLAVVVDDFDMGVTHIIRGVDHLTNAARQVLIYEAMGWGVPIMAHIPLIHGADGAKLSKRHGALGVEAYRDMGYLPQAMCNYLARLGWSHGDDEVFTMDQMIEWFDIKDVNKSAARFDFEKLGAINAQHMKMMDDGALIAALNILLPPCGGAVTPRVTEGGIFVENPSSVAARHLLPQGEKGVRILLPALKDRAKTLIDIVEGAAFLFAQTITPDEKAAALLTPTTLPHLKLVLDAIDKIEESNWNEDTLQATLKAIVAESGVKFGDLAAPLRAALTGKTTSPNLSIVMAALGREETLKRIAAQL